MSNLHFTKQSVSSQGLLSIQGEERAVALALALPSDAAICENYILELGIHAIFAATNFAQSGVN